MKLKLFQVDAFTDEVFKGNPAAICPLDQWLDDDLMQAIAIENNLSETAYFVGKDGVYDLRWFTPAAEVDLCGHATLASAHVVFAHLAPEAETVTFVTRSGRLIVTRGDGGLLVMDFPAQPGKEITVSEDVIQALGAEPTQLFAGEDLMAIFERESQIRAIEPNLWAVKELDGRGLIITAPGEEADFVSRFFVPKHNIPEDPVTGSAHCMLTPYWAERFGKSDLVARQISLRGGKLTCVLVQDRVLISGRAVLYMQGEITL